MSVFFEPLMLPGFAQEKEEEAAPKSPELKAHCHAIPLTASGGGWRKESEENGKTPKRRGPLSVQGTPRPQWAGSLGFQGPSTALSVSVTKKGKEPRMGRVKHGPQVPS